MKRVGVLGAGSWGTALAAHLAGGDHEVVLWARDPELAARLEVSRVNEAYLPGAELPTSVTATADLEAVAAAELVLVVVPSHGFREVLQRYLAVHPPGRPAVLVSATKGIESETLARMSQVAFEEGIAAERDVRFAVLSGPSFAAELARGAPTAAVIASDEGELAAELREELSTPSLRLYSSVDVVGVELGGTAKNVIAIAAGVVSGLELGHNTLAVLITRGLHEITRLGVAFGGRVRTFSGLSGLGDLVLTCTGGLSRNRRLGVELAHGRPLREVMGETTMVAEGVRNSVAIARLAERKGVEMPITEQMVEVLYEGKPARQAVEELMRRDLKAEAAGDADGQAQDYGLLTAVDAFSVLLVTYGMAEVPGYRQIRPLGAVAAELPAKLPCRGSEARTWTRGAARDVYGATSRHEVVYTGQSGSEMHGPMSQWHGGSTTQPVSIVRPPSPCTRPRPNTTTRWRRSSR